MSIALVLLAAAPLLIAATSLLSVVVGHHEEGEQAIGKETSALISCSGAQDALSRLELDPTVEGKFELPIDGGSASVTITPWADDGADNDENGDADDEEEAGFYDIESLGLLNAELDADGNVVERPVHHYRTDTQVIAERVELDFSFAQTIYIHDPDAAIDINGGAFELSGNDTEMDGSAGDEPARPAVGVAGDPQGIIDQIAGNQRDKIIGSLPNPAIGQTEPLDPQVYQDLIEPAATVRWDADFTSYSGPIGKLNPMKPVVAYCSGDLKLHGMTTGAGVLFVDGDLILDGHFEYAGVIFVRGNVSFQGGGGGKQLHGALVLWGQGDPESPDLEISGTVQVEYCSGVLDQLPDFARMRVLFWSEK